MNRSRSSEALWRPIRTIAAATAGLLIACGPAPAEAQSTVSVPAFSLASSQVASTHERPYVQLGFQQIEALDFRVYRVKDPFVFLQGLRDAHTLGSPEPLVPQEQTLVERVAEWKASWRGAFRSFARAQLSERHRVQRREARDTQTVQLRQVVGMTNFAQVPLLNPSQVVATWREVLPRVRDVQYRRIPLDLPGPGLYLVEAVRAPHRAYTLVVVSDIGIVAKTSPGQLMVYAANRFSGEPVPGCDVRALADQQAVASGRTDADGVMMARLDSTEAVQVTAIAQCGGEITLVDPGAFFLRESDRELLAYLYTDKPIYRPTHTMHFKAVLRWRTASGLLPLDRSTVEVAIADNSDRVYYRESLRVDEFGAVSGEFAVPAGAPLGYYSVIVRSGDQQTAGAFEVQEYRRPEYDVTLSPAAPIVLQGRDATVKIAARYFFGQPVANAAVRVAVHQSAYSSPLRWLDDPELGASSSYFYGGSQVREEVLRLDANGEALLTLATPVSEDGGDLSLRIDARVTDSSDREVSGSTTLVATYGDVVVATSLDRYVYAARSPARLAVRVIDYSGVPRANVPVAVAIERVTVTSGGEVTREPLTRAVVTTTGDGRALWTPMLPSESGHYNLSATVASAGRNVRAEETAWIPGSELQTADALDDRFLELQPDRKTYVAGDTARLLIQGEPVDGRVLVTKESGQVVWHAVPRVDSGALIDVPITDDDVGDVYVSIAYLKDDKLFRAERRLVVPAVERGLQVTIAADDTLPRPGKTAHYRITTLDARGQPVRAAVSVAVVDEAVFAVKAETAPDPLRFFYRLDYSRVNTTFSRTYAFIGYSGAQPLQLAERRRPFQLADFKREGPPRPHVRKDFPDAIRWVADLVTDAEGHADVEVTFPDALTTWRLTARAVTRDTKVGGAVARSTTTKDLILRLITPRFLTEGDTFEIPTIAHNYLPKAEPATMSMTASGLSTLDGTPHAPVSTSIRSNDEQRIDWPFQADRPGTALLTATVSGSVESDAVELSVPILPYGLERKVSQSGSLRTGEAQALLHIPDTSNATARTIDVTLTPTLAGSLFGALDFLAEYPYGCTEQTVSAFLPNLLVLRALNELKLSPTERLTTLDRMVNDGIRRLVDYQHEDGGWGWWKADANHPFMTAYAVYGLLEADRSGYRVDRFRLAQGITALIQLYVQYPRAVPDLKAYELYVLSLAQARGLDAAPGAGDRRFDLTQALEEVWTARDRLSSYGRSWLILSLDSLKDARGDALANDLARGAERRGDLVWWSADADPLLEDAIDASAESTATALRALATRPQHAALVDGGLRYLLANRATGGYWSSTKQTAMVLYGLLDYLSARGERPATFTVDVLVNESLVGTHTITPAMWTKASPITVTAAAREGENAVRLVKRGEGTLYWGASARFFDTRAALQPVGSRQLAVAREYFTLKPVQVGQRIVYRREPYRDTVAPGDLMLVHVTVAGSPAWRYLMLEDPLPAGVEVVRQPELYEIEGGAPDTLWWAGSQREYRDNRVVQFHDTLTDGRVELQYIVRASTVGVFRSMPARAVPMYAPGIHASSTTQRITVSPKDTRP